jgi:signal transduction histidine kinase
MQNRLVISFIIVALIGVVATGLGAAIIAQHNVTQISKTSAKNAANGLETLIYSVEQSILAKPACKLPTNASRIKCQDLILSTLKKISSVDAHLLLITPSGSIAAGSIPGNLNNSNFNLTGVLNGNPETGVNNDTAWAMVPLTSISLNRGKYAGDTAVLLTSEAVPPAPKLLPFIFLIALLTTAIAVVLSAVFSKNITDHINKLLSATNKIAQGDMEARVPINDRDYPELQALSLGINFLADEIKAKSEAQRNFFMSVSHDFKTPLTSISGYAEAMKDGTLNDYKKAADIILAEANRLRVMVDDLLNLGKLESSQFSVNVKSANLRPVLAEVLNAIEPTAKAANIAIHYELPQADVHAVMDPDRLSQVIYNILDNALKFAESQVTVKVQDNPTPIIEITDDGPGIKEGEIPKIFERFYTNSNYARKTGSGLGLAIARELVQKMGGRLEVKSPVIKNAGTTFKINLPGPLNGS